MAQKKRARRRARRRERQGRLTLALLAILGIAAAVLAHQFELGGGEAEVPQAGAGGVRINELMSDNGSTLVTENGEAPDWIEIINLGNEAVELEKYALMLETRPNRAFSFPKMTLESGECALVYAEGSDASGEMSARFKLSASGGERLILLDGQGQAVDAVELPELRTDEAYARLTDGSWEVRERATPGAANDGAAAVVSTGVQAAGGELELSEAMSGNTLYGPDENGECHDYVEIHNASGEAVNLAGWYLSDASDKLKKWSFPEVWLEAGGYLRVHCSGYDRTGDTANLHTNFRLSGSGESVYLSRPDGQTVSVASLPALETNQAYSLIDGAWTTQLGPTPGRENSAEAAAAVNAARFGEVGPEVRINEIMASAENEPYDWVEIYNGSASAVDLSGWGLSDDSDRPRRWQFPQGTQIQPGEYLGVFLSGRSEAQLNGYLNADFALSSAGGYTLSLSDASGEILDATYVPKQYGGWAYGRGSAGEAGFYYYEGGTPMAANAGTHARARAAEASCSTAGGLYESGERIAVELTAEAGSRIYYTLDSSNPDEGSTLYNGPIEISSTTILRTRVYRDGCLPSLTDTQSYLYDVDNGAGAYVISLVSDPDNLYSDERGIMVKGPNAWSEPPYGKINSGANFWMDWEREGHVELFEADGRTGISQGCGLKLHGQYSRQQKVKAFKIFARSAYGSNRFAYPIFSERDYGEYQSFLLRAAGQDYNLCFMRDVLLTSLAKDTSLMYQESELAICYLNGEYYSMMWVRERVSRFSICQFEGWEGMEDDIDLIKANDVEKEGSNESFEELLSWLRANDANTDEAYAYIDSHIDIQNYIEYMAIQIFSGNGDTLNVKRYRNAQTDGKWRWVLFDLDWGFYVDTNSIRRWLNPEGMGGNMQTDTTLFIACMDNLRFREAFINYMNEQLAGDFSTERMLERIEARYAQIEPLLDRYLEQIGVSRETYEENLEVLRDYARARPAKLLGYFQITYSLSDEQMQRYFGDAIAKLQADAQL